MWISINPVLDKMQSFANISILNFRKFIFQKFRKNQVSKFLKLKKFRKEEEKRTTSTNLIPTLYDFSHITSSVHEVQRKAQQIHTIQLHLQILTTNPIFTPPYNQNINNSHLHLLQDTKKDTSHLRIDSAFVKSFKDFLVESSSSQIL
jgi:flagellar biosynthesis protein FliP